MSQTKYTWDILKKFRMLSCKPATTPLEVGLKLYGHDDSNSVDVTSYRQLVGSLIYLTTTQPDISFAVSMVSRFMAKPKELHWKTTKRILRCLRGTVGYGLVYRSTKDFRLIGYIDSDWLDAWMTGNQLQGIHSVWVQRQLLGVLINNLQFLCPQHKQSIKR